MIHTLLHLETGFPVHKKWSFPLGTSFLSGKLHFFCAVFPSSEDQSSHLWKYVFVPVKTFSPITETNFRMGGKIDAFINENENLSTAEK